MLTTEQKRAQEARRRALERQMAIVERCEREGRRPYPDESAELDKLSAQATATIEDLGDVELQDPPKPRESYTPEPTAPTGASRDGRRLVLTRAESFTEWIAERGYGPTDLDHDERRQLSLGRMVRGMVTGAWDGAQPERRALLEGTDSAGGFTTPEVLSGPMIDRVRKKARVLEAGATTVPLESDKHSLPRLATGVTGAWRNEAAAVAVQDPTFERVTFEPKMLAVIVKLSFELFEDMLPIAAENVEAEIAQALALELDRVALRGSGSAPEPRGVRNQANVEVQSLGVNGATPSNYDPLVNAAGGVRRDNLEPNAYLYSARTEETFAKLKDTTNQPLQRPRAIENLSDLVTNQVPDNLTQGTSTDCSEVYTAQWDQLLVGLRPQVGVRIKRLDQTYAETMEIGLLAWLRGDIQLAHPEAFVVSTGVRP